MSIEVIRAQLERIFQLPSIAPAHDRNPRCTRRFKPGLWVRLLEMPTPLSFDEALLLCRLSVDEWLAWTPDHGEIRLRSWEFC